MEKTFIYTLSDPITKEVRYVGKSDNPKKRLYEHICSCKRIKNHKNNWINSLLKKDQKPILEIIDEVPLEYWQIYESQWISKLKELGFNLTNDTRGGNGLTKHSSIDIENMKIRYQRLPNYNRSGGNIKIPLDKDSLHQKYIVENLSIPKIAKLLDVSEKKVFLYLKEYNIQKDKEVWVKQCASQDRKPVLQYDLEGNLIKEWESKVSILNALNIRVGHCCKGRVKSTRGFIWRYKDEWFDLNLEMKDNQSKPVHQYDLKGNFINKYKSISEASKSSDVLDSGISSCCQKKSKSAGNFIWIYEGDNPPKKYTNKTIKAVIQYDLNGKFIAEYDSIIEAAKLTGSRSNCINMCCNNKINYSNNFIWKYK